MAERTKGFVLFRVDPKTNHGFQYQGRVCLDGVQWVVQADAVPEKDGVRKHFEGRVIRHNHSSSQPQIELPIDEPTGEDPNDPLPERMGV